MYNNKIVLLGFSGSSDCHIMSQQDTGTNTIDKTIKAPLSAIAIMLVVSAIVAPFAIFGCYYLKNKKKEESEQTEYIEVGQIDDEEEGEEFDDNDSNSDDFAQDEFELKSDMINSLIDEVDKVEDNSQE